MNQDEKTARKAGSTSGPWRTGDMYNTVFGPPNGNPCPEIVASVHRGNRANARLIAAAPELLEACELLMRYRWQPDGNMGESARVRAEAAIRKAKGE